MAEGLSFSLQLLPDGFMGRKWGDLGPCVCCEATLWRPECVASFRQRWEGHARRMLLAGVAEQAFPEQEGGVPEAYSRRVLCPVCPEAGCAGAGVAQGSGILAPYLPWAPDVPCH